MGQDPSSTPGPVRWSQPVDTRPHLGNPGSMLRETTVLTHLAQGSGDIVRENLVACNDLSLNAFYVPRGMTLAFQPMPEVDRLHILLDGACTILPGRNAFKVEKGAAVAMAAPGAHRILAAEFGVALMTIAFRHAEQAANRSGDGITLFDLTGGPPGEAAAQLASWASRPSVHGRAYLVSSGAELHGSLRVSAGSTRVFLVLSGKISVETPSGTTVVAAPGLLQVPRDTPHRARRHGGSAARVLLLSDREPVEDIVNHLPCGARARHCRLTDLWGDGQVVMDGEGAIVACNDAAADMLGLPSRPRGRSLFPSLLPEDAAWLSRRLRQPASASPAGRQFGSPHRPEETMPALLVPLQGQAKLKQAMLLLRAHARITQPSTTAEHPAARAARDPARSLEAFVAVSPRMAKIAAGLPPVAHSRAWAIVRGERGTGRTTVVRLLHHLESDPESRFVTRDCTGIDRAQLPGVLVRRDDDDTGEWRPGPWLLEARSGTLHLVHLQALPGKLQVEILHRLALLGDSGRRVTRVVIELDRRPHHGLAAEIPADPFPTRGGFAMIELPPLRDRPSDIPRLLEAFFQEFAGNHPPPSLSSRGFELLLSYRFPGNLLELRTIAEALSVFPLEGPVSEEALRAILGAKTPDDPAPDRRVPTLASCERDLVERALEQAGGNKSEAARLLGIPRARLNRLILKHQVR